jgi:hypothetical protein
MGGVVAAVLLLPAHGAQAAWHVVTGLDPGTSYVLYVDGVLQESGLDPAPDGTLSFETDAQGEFQLLPEGQAPLLGEQSGSDPAGDSTPKLDRVSPNPVRDVATLWLSVPTDALLRVDLYDVAGRRVGTLWEGHLPRGRTRVTTEVGGLSRGVYWAQPVVAGHPGRALRILLLP